MPAPAEYSPQSQAELREAIKGPIGQIGRLALTG
jgi:hypothetical protein